MFKDSPANKASLAKINREELMARLTPALAARPEILFAYLFGSAAKGTAGKMSDVDVAGLLSLGG